MIDMHLADLTGKLEQEATRKGFGRGLVLAGEANDQVVALCADLTGSTQMDKFKDAFPDRFVQIGVAEQNLATVGAGLAAMGKIPFISSYAAFSPGRNWEQIKTTIALNDQPVKIVGSHAGLHTGADGATHQMLEDIALMRAMPNMIVVVPGDSIEATKATLAMAKDSRPGYLRLTREATPVFTTDKTPFELGKAYVLSQGSDITIISTGSMTSVALDAAEALYKDGIDIEVLHAPTVKPLDAVTILTSVKKTKKVITIEEAQINGGLGGAVSELLGEEFPVPIKRLGVNDVYGESGTPAELLHKHGLTKKHVMMAAHAMLDKV